MPTGLARVSEANSSTERSAALEMLVQVPGASHRTVGADKAYDVRKFVQDVRALNVTAHVAQSIEGSGGSSLDQRTTRHAGYASPREPRFSAAC